MKTLIAAFAIAVTTAASAEDAILIGQSAPMTGPAAAAGTAFVAGAHACIDQVNHAGGIKGRPIELRTLDDMYSPERDETSRIVSHLQVLGIERISFFSLLIPESKVMFEHMGALLAQSSQSFFSSANVEPGKVDLVKAAAARSGGKYIR